MQAVPGSLQTHSQKDLSAMSDAQTRIDQLVKSNEIVLFMKGNASFPMCGFSGRAIQILKACGVWPTIPQLYVKGEFVGGSDIMMEMYQSGELQQVITGQS
jgi:monothiol glutaredoxin